MPPSDQETKHANEVRKALVLKWYRLKICHPLKAPTIWTIRARTGANALQCARLKSAAWDDEDPREYALIEIEENVEAPKRSRD